jgi:hypothetical protein
MPGTFSKASRPRRPGAYVNFEATTPTLIPPASASTVAIPLTHDWGPYKVPTRVNSYAEFLALYGETATPGKLAVRQCFQGEGLPGRPGAGAVIVYRFGLVSAAKATTSLQHSGSIAALRLDAKYEGTRGNTLTATTQANAIDGTAVDVILKLAGAEIERYTRLATDVVGLASIITQFSRYVTATSLVTGTALKTTITNQAFTGGTDGTPVDASAWTTAMSALEFERFGIIVPFDLTDSSVLTSFKTWVQNRNIAGQRFMMVVGGGPTTDTMATANTRSLSLADPAFVNVGGFSVADDTDNVGTLTTSQLAPRIAGILAARGESRSLTFARMANLRLLTAPTSAEVDQAFDSGTVTLTRDSNVVAPVRIEKALTTFASRTDPVRPYVIFRNPKFVRTMMGLETDIIEYAEGVGIIGELGVNDKTRASLVGTFSGMMAAREDANVVQSGWSVGVDQDPPPSDDDEFVAMRYSLRFLRTVEQVYSTIVVA